MIRWHKIKKRDEAKLIPHKEFMQTLKKKNPKIKFQSQARGDSAPTKMANPYCYYQGLKNWRCNRHFCQPAADASFQRLKEFSTMTEEPMGLNE